MGKAKTPKVTVDFSNPANLIQVLQMLSANDTNTIKTAEKALKPLLKQPQNAVLLINVLRTCEEVPVRHHASLLLRKKVGAFYSKYPAKEQTELKAELIRLLLAEPSSEVATGIAGAVAAVAEAAFDLSQSWEELFALLIKLPQEPDERLRLITYKLLTELCDKIPDHLKPHTPTLANLFVQGCQDPASKVAVEALSATSTYIKGIGNDPEVMHLTPVIKPLFEVLGRCLRNHDEDIVCEGLGLIQECFELEQPLINDFVEVIVQFALEIVNSTEYESDVVESAGQTLIATLQFRPKLFAKKGLVGPSLTVLISVIARSDPAAFEALYQLADQVEGEDDASLDPEFGRQKMAQMIIDYMAVNVPVKYFADVALSLVSQGITSPEPQMRKAGCAVLGIIVEGLADNFREKIEMILPALLSAFSDPEYYVRECATFAMGQFAEFLQPDILTYHSSILPVVFNALEDDRYTIQGHACYILENFCENLQPKTLRPFLGPLMNKLVQLFRSEKSVTKEMALSAISSTAVAAEKEFIPYAAATCEILQPYLFLTEPKQFVLRGRSLECLGHIAIALGRTEFQPYFQIGMQSCTQGVSLNDEDLKEHSFLFIANVVKAMKSDFAPFIEGVVPYLCEMAQEPELTAKGGDDDDEEDEDAEAGPVDDDDDTSKFDLRLTEGFINTKKAAITALGALAEHAKEHFAPFLKLALESLVTEDEGACYSYHESIRGESLVVLQSFVRCALATVGIHNAPAQGTVLALDAPIAEIVRASLTTCLAAMQDDEDKTPVSMAIESVDGILKLVGVAALNLSDNVEGNPQVFMTRVMNMVLLILSEKLPCQMTSAADAHEDDEDEDGDDPVMVSVSDLITTLALLLGGEFKVYFDEFHKHLMKFTKPSRSYSDRAMAIGCYADVLSKLGPLSLHYADSIMPIVQAGLSDPMEGIRRNSAVCVGSLAESAGPALHSHYLLLLQWLHPLCIRKEKHRASDSGGADVDNALASVAKMITSSPTAVPLAQVLPVILQALPLSDDHQEGPGIYKCIASLVLQGEPTAVSIVQQIVVVLAEPLTQNSSAIDETKSICASALRELARNPNYTALVQGYVGTIADPVDQQVFRTQVFDA